MTEPAAGHDTCDSCGRRVLATGSVFKLEAARDREGLMQADIYIQGLLLSKKRTDRERADDLAVRFEEFAETGTLEIPLQLNELQSGIWEVKAGKVRVPFFYTDENGDAVARFTHGFWKNTDETPRGEIDRATGIRREDGRQ